MRSKVSLVGTGILVGGTLALGLTFYGTDSPRYTQTPQTDDVAQPNGKWFRYRTHRFDADLTAAQREQLEALEAIGYADGTVPGDGRGQVTTHDPERAQPGYNFYASGHGPEAVLMDNQGQEIHRWHHEFWETFSDYPLRKYHGGTNNFRRVRLLEGGDVIGIHEGLALVRFDKDNQTQWASTVRAHHDLDIHPSGDLVVLIREARMMPRLDPIKPVMEDFVSILDLETGEELRRISLVAALEASPWSDWLDERPDKADFFHTNTLAVLDGASVHPAFASGRVLLSMRNMNLLAVLDIDTGQLVWAHRGPYRLQHEPSLTAAGNLLLFDNRGGKGARRTRVSLYGLPDMSAIWHYTGGESPLHSPTLGTAAELPNGNILITESERGRAIEITPDSQEIVWEFLNPHTAGPNQEYIAALFEMNRVPPDFDVSWAKGSPTPAAGTRVQPHTR